jgi:hypothetical protein
MRFRLRSLMIVLTVGPPILAGLWFLASRYWILRVSLSFAAFWLFCGLLWTLLMRVVEPLLEGKRG